MSGHIRGFPTRLTCGRPGRSCGCCSERLASKCEHIAGVRAGLLFTGSVARLDSHQSSLRLIALRRRRRPPVFRNGSHARFLRGWRRFSWIRLLPAFRHTGHARFSWGWHCFIRNRRNHREGVTGGAGNLPPGVLWITFQALPAMGTVEFKLAHKAFLAGGTNDRRKR